MIFTIDIGNTYITAGCVQNGQILFSERLSSDSGRTPAEYAIDFKLVLEFHSIRPSVLKGAILSCVVPSLAAPVQEALRKLGIRKPLLVGPGLKTGLKIMIDNPAQLGGDLVVAAVAAVDRYPAPIIGVALDTATTFFVIDREKRFLGGAIAPGIRISLKALENAASQLPSVELAAPPAVIGTNTVSSMKSGAVLGAAAMIDGMIERIEAQLGESASVIATGDLAATIIPNCRRAIHLDDGLLLKGLALLYQKNA